MFLQQMRLNQNQNKNQNERRDQRFYILNHRVYYKIKPFFLCIVIFCIFVELTFADSVVFSGKGFHINIDDNINNNQCIINVDVVFDHNKNQIKETALEVASVVEDYLAHLDRKFGLHSIYKYSYTGNTVNVIVTGDRDVCDKAMDEVNRFAFLTGDLHE
jgi:hypothetical protein